ncbi:MAG: hypothetical protein ACREX3_23280, partial [Gammaproteobacteria bacterium]
GAEARDWSWVEASVWTERMVLALENGVKGGCWYSLMDKVYAPVGYEFKVILTNQCLRARKALAFHQGRGSQEGLFAALKTDNQLDYVPTRTWVGNQIYLLSVLLAHNLGRELPSSLAHDAGETPCLVGLRAP